MVIISLAKMPKIDPFKIITDTFGILIKFLDNAYKEGWLLYLVGGLIILAVFIIFFN